MSKYFNSSGFSSCFFSFLSVCINGELFCVKSSGISSSVFSRFSTCFLYYVLHLHVDKNCETIEIHKNTIKNVLIPGSLL